MHQQFKIGQCQQAVAERLNQYTNSSLARDAQAARSASRVFIVNQRPIGMFLTGQGKNLGLAGVNAKCQEEITGRQFCGRNPNLPLLNEELRNFSVGRAQGAGR